MRPPASAYSGALCTVGSRCFGQLVVGMTRQGYDLQLTRYGDEWWRATFYPAGRAHSIVAGTAWEPTPSAGVRHAAGTGPGGRL